MGILDAPSYSRATADLRFPRRWSITNTSASTYTASPGEWVRSSGAPATITLPASPAIGDEVAIQRVQGSITVSIASGSGHDINGQSTVGIAGIAIPTVVYTYVGSGHWSMVSTSGVMQFGLSVGAQGGYLLFGQTTSNIIATTPGYVSGSAYFVQGGDKNIFIDAASGITSLVYAYSNPDTSVTSVQIYQHTHFKNDSTNTVTITCPNGGKIDGAASYELRPGRAVEIAVIQAPTSPGGSNLPAIVEIVGAFLPPSRRTDPTGSLAATFDRATLTSSPQTLTSGTGVMALLEITRACTVTTFNWRSGSTAATSPTHQWGVLKDSAGKVVAVTADGTTAAIAANTTQSWAFSAATVVPAGLYYVELMVAATTPPTVTGSSGSTQLAALPPIMAGNDPTAGRTTPPSVAASDTVPASAGTWVPYVWLT